MHQLPCGICPYVPLESALWLSNNLWFSKDSSLAEAINGYDPRPYSAPGPQGHFSDLEAHPGQEVPMDCHDTHVGSPCPSTPLTELASQSGEEPEASQEYETTLGSPDGIGSPSIYTSSTPAASQTWDEHTPEPSRDQYDSASLHESDDEGEDEVMETTDAEEEGEIVNLRNGKKPYYCRVEDCRSWHSSENWVWRHRNGHFENGYLCPNLGHGCFGRGGSFKTKEGLFNHCRRFPNCNAALDAVGREVEMWGYSATEEDLVSLDPTFHKPYRQFFGLKGPAP